MNVRRHAQRRHQHAIACAPRARAARMRRLLTQARLVFARARELDEAAQRMIAPLRTGQLWPPRRPGLPEPLGMGKRPPSVPYASYPPEYGTGRRPRG